MNSISQEPTRQPASESFLIELTPVPGDPRPPLVRVRAALKALLRSYGLRCRSLRPVTPSDGEAGR